MKTVLIHAWVVIDFNGDRRLPSTHLSYLTEIVKYYDRVYLLAPVVDESAARLRYKNIDSYGSLSIFKSVEIVKLPPSLSYMGAIKNFFHYVRAYKNLPTIDVYYSRFPVPFGWLQFFYARKKKKIIHYVGDPIDTVLKNDEIGFAKKILLIAAFLPEMAMYIVASLGNVDVYTNGNHLAKKISRFGVKPKVLISSTLTESDFNPVSIDISLIAPRFIYVGYLRKAKGIDVLLKVFYEIQKLYPQAVFDIVGDGEYDSSLKQYVAEKNISSVFFHGHIDDRNVLRDLLRSSNIFLFASLSEGSPRVILEAIANGLTVVTTPVGSLPSMFVDRESIYFSDFNNVGDFVSTINLVLSDVTAAQKVSENAKSMIRNNTIQKFLQNIFE